jgi:hypothetical protein
MTAEVGKITLFSTVNGDEALSNNPLQKSNGDEALNVDSLKKSTGDEALNTQ